MIWRTDASTREQALRAEDVIAIARSLSAQAQALRERGRELVYLAKRNRSEASELSTITRQIIKDTQNLADEVAEEMRRQANNYAIRERVDQIDLS